MSDERRHIKPSWHCAARRSGVGLELAVTLPVDEFDAAMKKGP